MLIFIICKQFVPALDFVYLCKILCVENVPVRIVPQAGVHRKPNQQMTESFIQRRVNGWLDNGGRAEGCYELHE